MSKVSVVNKTRGKTPRVQWQKLKDTILGSRYELSVALLTPKASRAITKKTKNKHKASNVLAFPLSRLSGEILLCPKAAKPFTVEYLFIHGCLHLKGLKHGVTMNRKEAQLLTRFRYAKNSHRH